MATQTDLGPLLPTTQSERPALAQLWQVPTFFAGLMAVLGIAVTIPWRHGPSPREMDRDIAVIRRALDEPGAGVERVVALAEKVLARTDHDPDRAGEVHFLLGSIYQRLADQAPATRVPGLRERALIHLGQAEQRGVPEGDQARLAYRLGKAWFLTGHHWRRALGYLGPTVAGAADDPAEGYRMVAQANLLLPAPDLAAAYDANLKLLALPTDDEDILGPVRLSCGEILLQQKKPGEALKMLETITSQAPRTILSRARFLQGRCCQDLASWDRAILYWQEVLRAPGKVAEGRGQILYYLGQCYQNLEQPDEAAKVWKRAVERGGEGGQAAAMGLADLYLAPDAGGHLSNPSAALESFKHALAKLTRPRDYRNSLIGLDQARDRIRWGCKVFRKYHDFESALDLAGLYRRIALPGVAEDQEGRAARAWARELDAQPRPTRNPDAAAWDAKIHALFARAGTAFEAAAAALPAEDQPAALWASSRCFLRGRLDQRAVPVLEKFVHHARVPEENYGEGWFTLAETQLVIGHKDLALEAYHKAIEYRGPYAFRARFQLAQAELDFRSPHAEEVKRHVKQARALLSQILDPGAKFDAPPDVRQRSQFLLGQLLFQGRQFIEAKLTLEAAVEQYPDHPQILPAREQLAECYRRLADEAIELINNPEIKGDMQLHYRRKKNELLDKAADDYQRLVDDLDKRTRTGRLSETDQELLRRAAFAVADCRFDQDNMTAEALRLYRVLAEERYPHRVESLAAYKNIWRCACRMSQPEEARLAAHDAWLALEKMSDAELTRLAENAYRGSPGPLSRADWKKWLTWMGDQLPRPGTNAGR